MRTTFKIRFWATYYGIHKAFLFNLYLQKEVRISNFVSDSLQNGSALINSDRTLFWYLIFYFGNYFLEYNLITLEIRFVPVNQTRILQSGKFNINLQLNQDILWLWCKSIFLRKKSVFTICRIYLYYKYVYTLYERSVSGHETASNLTMINLLRRWHFERSHRVAPLEKSLKTYHG